jgi:hypothetical protein
MSMPGFVSANLVLLAVAVAVLLLGLVVWIIWDSRRKR